MTGVLLVDGYNIINHWQQLLDLSAENLDDARQKLVEILTSYTGFKGQRLVVVFDAHSVWGGREKWEQIAPHVHIVFTKQGETADTVIERLAYEMQGHAKVWVATSDKEEQYYVLGKGAVRLSARELEVDVKLTHKEMSEGFAHKPTLRNRNVIADKLSPHVKRQLEAWRRRK